MVTGVKRVQHKSDTTGDSALAKDGRERGWMKRSFSQSGRRGRARQQGFNIPG